MPRRKLIIRFVIHNPLIKMAIFRNKTPDVLNPNASRICNGSEVHCYRNNIKKFDGRNGAKCTGPKCEKCVICIKIVWYYSMDVNLDTPLHKSMCFGLAMYFEKYARSVLFLWRNGEFRFEFRISMPFDVLILFSYQIPFEDVRCAFRM